MAGEHNGWVGSRLPILPGESTLSIQLRVGFSNAFTGIELRRYFGYGNGSRNRNRNRYRTRLTIPLPQASERLGLPAPADEADAFEQLAFLVPVVFDVQFKFCRDCLQGGYHSFWFQIKTIDVCPVHGSHLSKACGSCSAPTLLWKDAIAYADYKCPSCSMALGGRSFSYRDLLKNRPASGTLRCAFQTCQSWVEGLRDSGVVDLCAVVRDYAIFMQVQEVLAGILSRYGPLPYSHCKEGAPFVLGVVSPSHAAERVQCDRTSNRIAQDEELMRQRAIYRRARAAIVHHYVHKIDERAVFEVRKMISRADIFDLCDYELQDISFAMLDACFDEVNNSFSATRRWMPTTYGLGLVSEPRFSAVRRLPDAWFCVVLAVFSMVVEIVGIIQSENVRREHLRIALFRGLLDGTRISLNRLMIRRLIFASVPVISIEGHDRPGSGSLNGIFVPVPHFDGLESIVNEERLIQFDAVRHIRSAPLRTDRTGIAGDGCVARPTRTPSDWHN